MMIAKSDQGDLSRPIGLKMARCAPGPEARATTENGTCLAIRLWVMIGKVRYAEALGRSVEGGWSFIAQLDQIILRRDRASIDKS